MRDSSSRRRQPFMGLSVLHLVVVSLFWLTATADGGVEPAVDLASFRTEDEAQSAFQVTEATELDSAVEIAISKGWWILAKDIIRESHTRNVDLSAKVRATVLGVKKSADELIRLLDKNHDEIQKISPAFQWAQSEDTIFLLIKFAYRWSSPGALAVEKENVTVSASVFYFSGLGTNSHAGKLYELDLELFDVVDHESTEWSFASVGKLSVTLKKQSKGMWQRLTKSTEKRSNMHIWWEMREKYDPDFKTVDEDKDSKKGGKSKDDSKESTEGEASSQESSADEIEKEGGESAEELPQKGEASATDGGGSPKKDEL